MHLSVGWLWSDMIGQRSFINRKYKKERKRLSVHTATLELNLDSLLGSVLFPFSWSHYFLNVPKIRIQCEQVTVRIDPRAQKNDNKNVMFTVLVLSWYAVEGFVTIIYMKRLFYVVWLVDVDSKEMYKLHEIHDDCWDVMSYCKEELIQDHIWMGPKIRTDSMWFVLITML